MPSWCWVKHYTVGDDTHSDLIIQGAFIDPLAQLLGLSFAKGRTATMGHVDAGICPTFDKNHKSAGCTVARLNDWAKFCSLHGILIGRQF